MKLTDDQIRRAAVAGAKAKGLRLVPAVRPVVNNAVRLIADGDTASPVVRAMGAQFIAAVQEFLSEIE